MSAVAKKNVDIPVRVEAHLRDLIKRKADLIGVSMGAYVRAVVLHDLELTIDDLIALNRADLDDMALGADDDDDE